MRSVFVMICLSASLFASSAFAGEPIRVMFYNVYNLFDADKDFDKNDWTFLPVDFKGKKEECEKITNQRYKDECLNTDWNNTKVDLKIAQLKEAIMLAADGELPDILGVCEVENEAVTRRLANALGYRFFKITNSPDVRGIDVALLYNERAGLEFKTSHEHTVSANKPTRNILETVFKVGNEKLHLFVNHWPSQAADAVVREGVARQFQKVVDRRLKRNPAAKILAMGDFNVIHADYPHPFKGVISHKDNPNRLQSVDEMYAEDRSVDLATKRLQPLGTYFYFPNMEWNKLDRFFVNENLTNNVGLQVDHKTFRIKNPTQIVGPLSYTDDRFSTFSTVIAGVPLRGNFATESALDAGYSDHLPIYVELKGE